MVEETHPHLERAPITEAILDINVEADAKLEVTESFARQVAPSYPDASPLFAVEAFFSVTPGQAGMGGSQSNAVGRICWNAQKTRAVQARVNGFTVNHVKRYESWAVLRAEAQPLWHQYAALVKPKKVTRLALRYINRITLPVSGDLSQYMLTHPTIGPSLPRALGSFFMRVEVPFSPQRVVTITQTVVPRQPESDERDLILDVDAIAQREFDSDDPQIWYELDDLRAIKNMSFFGSLREQTWRRYQ